MANCRQLSVAVVVVVIVDLQQKVAQGPMLQYITIRYVTLRDDTQRLRYGQEKYFCVGPQQQQRCVSLYKYVCVCLRAGSPFWPNGVRQTAVAVGEPEKRKGVAVAVATLTISRRNARTIRLHA